MFRVAIPRILSKFLLGSLVLTVAAVVARLVCVYVLHLTEYPYTHYSLPHNGDGLDLTNFYPRFKHIHSPEFFLPMYGSVYTYPAALAPLYWLFYQVRHPQIPFLIAGVCIMLALMVLFIRALQRHGLPSRAAMWFVGCTALLSFPFYFEFTRANMELFVWLFTSVGIFLVLRDRPWLGATFLAVGTSMKLYPFIFAGLLFSRRRYLPLAWMFAASIFISLASLWFICPDIAYANHRVQAGIAYFQMHYVLVFSPVYNGVDHSIFGLMKRIAGSQPAERYAAVLSGYMAIAAGIGLAAYFLRIRRLPMLNQVLALTVATVVLPPTSFEYTLINLYTPWVLLCLLAVDAWRGKQQVAGLAGIFACFVVLFSNVGEIILHGDRLGGQIKAVTLMVLFGLALMYPLPSWIDPAPRLARRRIDPGAVGF